MSIQNIENLDLEPIMVKVMDEEELGWSLAFTKQIAGEYRKYLVLCLENPEFPMVPSVYVDDFWHFHILDTMKYQEDCENIFGYFLHHFPYFGMRSEEDANDLRKAWSDSCDLYESRFGTINPELWPKSRRCPNCGRQSASTNPHFSEARPRLVA